MSKGIQLVRDRILVPPCIPWQTGRFYSSPVHNAGLSTYNSTTAALAIPIYVPNPAGVTVTSISVEETTAGAGGSKGRLAIYDSHPLTGLPNKLILDAGQVATDTGGAPVALTVVISQFLRQGWYWVGWAETGGTIRAFTAGGLPWYGALVEYTIAGTPAGAVAFGNQGNATPVQSLVNSGFPQVAFLASNGAIFSASNPPRILLGI